MQQVRAEAQGRDRYRLKGAEKLNLIDTGSMNEEWRDKPWNTYGLPRGR